MIKPKKQTKFYNKLNEKKTTNFNYSLLCLVSVYSYPYARIRILKELPFTFTLICMSVSVFSVFKITFFHFHFHPPPFPLPHTAAAAQRLKSLGLCKSRGVIKKKKIKGEGMWEIFSWPFPWPRHEPELTTARSSRSLAVSHHGPSRPGAHDITTTTSRTLFLVLSFFLVL